MNVLFRRVTTNMKRLPLFVHLMMVSLIVIDHQAVTGYSVIGNGAVLSGAHSNQIDGECFFVIIEICVN